MKIHFFLILLCFFLLGCKESGKTEEEHNRSQISSTTGIEVSSTIVEDLIFKKQIIANGIVEARESSELRFKTSEELENIYVRNGQKVDKGALLASLHNSLLVTQLEKAKIALGNAERLLMVQKIKFGLGGKSNEEIKPEVLKTLLQNSGYREAKNQFENAQLLYKQTMLRAPFSGTIANLKVKEGNYITPSTVFGTLFSQQRLDVIFYVLESEISFVENGQDVEIIPFALSDNSYEGKIIEINPMVGEQGLIRIKAEIVSRETEILTGMNVKILVNKPLENVLVVPKEAVVLRTNREVIFSIKDGLAKWNYVQIVDENSTHYAIEEGIMVGDTIIVTGNLNLAQNSVVNSTFITPD